jgi:Zn-dependent oligopeptidase
MISIEYALDKYTDLINEKQSIDFEYFKSELLPNDYIEFMDEIKYINIIKSNSVTKSFKQLFEKIDEYKNELYQLDNVVNFRSKVTNDDTIKKIEEIFEEEFKDE